MAAAGIFARTFRSYRTFNFMSRRIEGYQIDSQPERRAAQNIKQRPAKRPSRYGSRDYHPGSCNGLFSLGIPYRGSGGSLQPCSSNLTWPNEPASHFPLRAGHTPTGKLHCLSCNLLRVAQATLHCNSAFIRLQLFENTSGPGLEQAEKTCGKPPNLWETIAWSSAITPLE
jgi:hypothetical protein